MFKRVRASLVAVLLIATVVPATSTGATADCRYRLQGQIAYEDGLEGLRYSIYDLLHPPGAEAVVDPQEPSENRDSRDRVAWTDWLTGGSTDATGRFDACVEQRSGTDRALEEERADVFLEVRADGEAASVHPPDVVDGTLNNVFGGNRMRPSPGEVYTAYTGEHRNVARDADLGTFRDARPTYHPYGKAPPIPGEEQCMVEPGGGELVCVCMPSFTDAASGAGSCEMGTGPVPTSFSVDAGFDVLRKIQIGWAHVDDLEQRMSGDSNGPITAVYPWGNGGGRAWGTFIALGTTSTETVLHEYGHAMQSRYTDVAPSGTHNCKLFDNGEDAFSGGFAAFFVAWSRGAASLADCGDAEVTSDMAGGQRHEINVQDALWDLVDDDAEDAYDGDDLRFWRVFTNEGADDGTFATYQEFHDHWVDLRPADCEELVRVAAQNGIDVGTCPS